VSGYCVDCGELYELDALDLDLRCADCVKQLVLDKQEREGAR
jgi:DNA-directed RNA polymerase subunit RPC12/RpoP